MISQTNNSLVSNAYGTAQGDVKTQRASLNVTKQGDTSKIDQIKESLASGEYKIDLETLSKKIADELM